MEFWDCKILRNIGSFINPIFTCEECNYYYTLLVDENQIQKCKYMEGDLLSCSKAVKIKVYDEQNSQYIEDYNCTECAQYYELEYDNITNKMKCKSNKCFADNCAVCKDNELYYCKICKSGFVFNKFDQCIIKIKNNSKYLFQRYIQIFIKWKY